MQGKPISLEPPRREVVLTCTDDLCFEQKLEKCHVLHITKTCPCNVYPLEPHFYIAKLEYTGVYLVFLFLLQNINCRYSLEPPHRADFS